jgi:hypothetical protein
VPFNDTDIFQVTLHSLQMSHGLTWDRTSASAVKGLGLTARAMAWPSGRCNDAEGEDMVNNEFTNFKYIMTTHSSFTMQLKPTSAYESI